MTLQKRDDRWQTISRHNQGVFLLKANQRQFRVTRVDNVSMSGAGLHLPARLAPGTRVTLTYTEHDWHITLRGLVVWVENKPESRVVNIAEPEFRMGVHFDRDDMENNQLFFLALRASFDTLEPRISRAS